MYNDPFFNCRNTFFHKTKRFNSLPAFINCILQIQLLKPNSLFWLQQIHILRRIVYQGWAGQSCRTGTMHFLKGELEVLACHITDLKVGNLNLFEEKNILPPFLLISMSHHRVRQK